jgi:DNA replication and repair protein RecF
VQLAWLQLGNFRSYLQLSWAPEPGVNILVGPNGAGKTNVLEAVAYLASLRSFRGAPEEWLVRDDGASGIVRGEERESRSLVEVEIYRRGGRKARIDQKPIARTSDLLTILRTVAFLPDDLDLIKGGPAGRRALLDDLSLQLWPAAAGDQAEFDRALRQRNAFLKHFDRDPATLDVWDARLAQAAARLMGRRARAASAIVEVLGRAYAQIACEGARVEFAYESDWGGSLDSSIPTGEWASALAEKLGAQRKLDMELRTTSSGPHRDDPALVLSGRRARFQASQGEQRTLALALRLASHRAVSEQTGRTPMLLLDDVYSELDPERAKALTDALPPAQTFVTTTRLDEVPLAGRPWQVGDGTIR